MHFPKANFLIIAISVLIAFAILGCKPGDKAFETPEGSIMTVLGPISPESLGTTLIHEPCFSGLVTCGGGRSLEMEQC